MLRSSEAFDQRAMEQEVRLHELAGGSIVTQASYIVDGRFSGEWDPAAAGHLPHHLKLQRNTYKEEIT